MNPAISVANTREAARPAARSSSDWDSRHPAAGGAGIRRQVHGAIHRGLREIASHRAAQYRVRAVGDHFRTAALKHHRHSGGVPAGRGHLRVLVENRNRISGRAVHDGRHPQARRLEPGLCRGGVGCVHPADDLAGPQVRVAAEDDQPAWRSGRRFAESPRLLPQRGAIEGRGDRRRLVCDGGDPGAGRPSSLFAFPAIEAMPWG